MRPPGYIVTALQDLGFNWPESDEERLFHVGEAWQAFHPDLNSIIARLDSAAQSVWTQNSGAAIDAFREEWTHIDGLLPALADATVGAQVMAPLLMLASAVVLALKISVIVQVVLFLVQTASAVAEAFATGGASLALIALWRAISARLINLLIALATEAILG